MKIRHILDSLGRDLRPGNIALLLRYRDNGLVYVGPFTVLDHIDTDDHRFVLNFIGLYTSQTLEAQGYYCDDYGYFFDYTTYKLAEGKAAL
jgi:hypothetical protein